MVAVIEGAAAVSVCIDGKTIIIVIINSTCNVLIIITVCSLVFPLITWIIMKIIKMIINGISNIIRVCLFSAFFLITSIMKIILIINRRVELFTTFSIYHLNNNENESNEYIKHSHHR